MMTLTGIEALEKYEAKWGQIDRHDALAGRIDWTFADYMEAGRAEFDRVSRSVEYPGRAVARETYARAYVRINLPQFKRDAQKEIAA